jgi:hypothetical protein
MDAAYVPVAVAFLTVLGGTIVYAFQKRADRRAELIEIRRTVYRRQKHQSDCSSVSLTYLLSRQMTRSGKLLSSRTI